MKEHLLSHLEKIKLRRIKTSPPQDLIEQNLIPLKENIKKKKRAQEAYYENHQARLGRRVPFNGTNTSAIPPKFRLRRVGNFSNQQNVKKFRIFSAQHRLNRIRAQQRELLNTPDFRHAQEDKTETDPASTDRRTHEFTSGSEKQPRLLHNARYHEEIQADT
ncbi:hypothetical protein NQ318_009615 [Aromia moschata]|uniref:Uncharacterized protein n=1 Tax=Aromia moschata TaxID=1265417 RepID=A0AAV8Y8V5_9CUCU|nr:hypothetical protein NQ318_009615 [Aromia moschata]